MINRAAILLRYKEPAIRWINEADPADDDPGITEAEVNRERTVYLISDLDGDTQESVDRWIKRNYQELFETELEDWYTDPSLWPEKRTLKLFRQWFSVECHTVVIDTVEDAIIEDDI